MVITVFLQKRRIVTQGAFRCREMGAVAAFNGDAVI